MLINDPFRKIARAPEGEGAPAGGAGDPPPATPPAGDPPATPPAGDPPAPKWWEGESLTAEQRTQITALGLTVDDPVQAVAKLADMEAAAKRKLGKPADQLMDRPGKDQDVGEWLRSHGDMFGIPADPDGYEIPTPEGWPKDAQWNKDLEGKARALGHKHGLSGAALNEFVGLYASEVGRLVGDAGDQLAAANAEMQAELQRDWGDKYAAKVAQAQAAVGVVAEKAGISAEGIAAISEVLKPKVGDAGIVKLFAAVGELMGEDALIRGDGGLGTTPAEARAKLAELRAPGGAYYEATAKNDKAALKRLAPDMERLAQIAGS